MKTFSRLTVVALCGAMVLSSANKASADYPKIPYSWGFNGFGQLGNGSDADSYSATPGAPLANVIGQSGGAYFSLAVTSSGSVYSWGANNAGHSASARP